MTTQIHSSKLQTSNSPDVSGICRSSLLVVSALFCAAMAAQAQIEVIANDTAYKVKYAFTGGSDGSEYNTLAPFDAGMLRDREGNLYGTAFAGGYFSSEFDPCPGGCGVVFKLDKARKYSVLYAFTGNPDGSVPAEGLARDEQGNLYGTTIFGGPANAGTVFRIDPAGKETLLYSFTGMADGGNPWSGVIRDEEGNLYGTAGAGGLPDCFFGGCGVVFKVDRQGHETVLYSFTGGNDGGKPTAGLTRDKDGGLYGTTNEYGSLGYGVVFKIDCEGKESVLYAFKGPPDGWEPTTALVRDDDGSFYGATSLGGSTGPNCGSFGCGVIYKLDRLGKETVVYTFAGGDDGSGPSGRLLHRGQDLYGVTYFGGTPEPACVDQCGTVFKVDEHGKHTILYSFQGGALGSNPQGGLVEDKGALYGITGFGGEISQPDCPGGCGVIFKLKTAEPCDEDEASAADPPGL